MKLIVALGHHAFFIGAPGVQPTANFRAGEVAAGFLIGRPGAYSGEDEHRFRKIRKSVHVEDVPGIATAWWRASKWSRSTGDLGGRWGAAVLRGSGTPVSLCIRPGFGQERPITDYRSSLGVNNPDRCLRWAVTGHDRT